MPPSLLICNYPGRRYPAPQDLDDETDIVELESEDEDLDRGQELALQEQDDADAEQVESDDNDLGAVGPELVEQRALQEVHKWYLLHL